MKNIKGKTMRRILNSLAFLLIICYMIMVVGCAKSGIADNIQSTASHVENSDLNSVDTVGSEIVNNLKIIEIENLNEDKNSKVVLNMPEDWSAKELIFDKAPDFEFNMEKNKQIKKLHDFEFYNSMKMDKYKQLQMDGIAGRIDMPSYYRDESERARFPNHSQVKTRVYSGDTVLGQGEIFILDCDLPKELRTEKYTTYDMVYVWIPIDNEALAYNLTIGVPLGEKDDDYIEMVKTLLKANTIQSGASPEVFLEQYGIKVQPDHATVYFNESPNFSFR
jgi:hypothetical protein